MSFFGLNIDSNEKMAKKSTHDGCPVIDGTKIVVSNWIRMRSQNQLKSSFSGPDYAIENIFKNFMFK